MSRALWNRRAGRSSFRAEGGNRIKSAARLACLLCAFVCAAEVVTAQGAAPANGRIAFMRAAASGVRGFDVLSVNPDGTGESNLTVAVVNSALDASPAWSPDGRRLVFVSDRDGLADLYTMDANGGDVRRLTNTPDVTERQPAWSPDGRSIAYVAIEHRQTPPVAPLSAEIRVVPSAGGSARRVTSGGGDASPAWSPDNRRIMFASYRNGTDGALYVVNSDGTGERLFYDLPNANEDDPAWSPDGARVLFVSDVACGGVPSCESIYTIGANGGEARRLSTNAPVPHSDPAWSPDGTNIAFVVGARAGAPGIYVADADGRDARRLTTDNGVTGITGFDLSWGAAPAPTTNGELRFDFAPARQSVAENGGTARITVRRSGGRDGRGDLDQARSVLYHATNVLVPVPGCAVVLPVGSARPNVDYVPAQGELSFAIGEETKTFDVSVLDDTEIETRQFDSRDNRPAARQTEAIYLSLDYSRYAPTTGDRCYSAHGTLDIVDDDAPHVATSLRAWTNSNANKAYVRLTFADDSYRVRDWGVVRRDGTTFAATITVEPSPDARGIPGVATSVAYLYDLGDAPAGTYRLDLRITGDRGATDRSHPFALPGSIVANPIDTTRSFVAQQYRDFLSREPEQSGADAWARVLETCGADAGCVRAKRVEVSSGFFRSQEFFDTGYFVFRLYRTTHARRPTYAEFVRDAPLLDFGDSGDRVAASKLRFAQEWVTRPEFLARYPASLTNSEFINRFTRTAGLLLFDGVDLLPLTRAEIVVRIADLQVVRSREYNSAFVTMQYFGYLRRDPEPTGYDAWLRVLDARPNDYADMIFGFLYSPEYRGRFGQP